MTEKERNSLADLANHLEALRRAGQVRLDADESAALAYALSAAPPGEIALFGSRVEPNRRGGDIDSTLAGALAAVKVHIPVAHVEAGLRSYNCRMPEEINRVFTDHRRTCSSPPTDTATRNLANEGISSDKVRQVGDVLSALVVNDGSAKDLRR